MSSLTQLSQAIHDAPRWHLANSFQEPSEIRIEPLTDEALVPLFMGLMHVKHNQVKLFSN